MENESRELMDEVMMWFLIIAAFPAIYFAWHLGIFQDIFLWLSRHFAWFFERWGQSL